MGLGGFMRERESREKFVEEKTNSMKLQWQTIVLLQKCGLVFLLYVLDHFMRESNHVRENHIKKFPG